jgi:signal transduction histidine kinase/CheY-like chemotaxis protein
VTGAAGSVGDGVTRGGAARPDTAPEISTRVLSACYLYYEHLFGRHRLLAALAKVGGEPTLDYLLDHENFVSLDYYVRLARVLTDESGDPQFVRKAGHFRYADPRALGSLFHLVRSFGSPQLYYRVVAKAGANFNRVCETTIEQLTDRHLRLRYRSLRPEKTRLLCEGRLGTFEAAPTLWGLPLARAHEAECQIDGAAACVYEIDWVPAIRPIRRALAGGIAGAIAGGIGLRLAGAAVGAVMGALVMLVVAYRADSRRKSRWLLDGAAAGETAIREVRARLEELQRLHAETAASHRSLGEEMRRREQAEIALAEAQKVETVRQLSAGFAPDFNNILTVILSRALDAKARSVASSEVSADLDAISDAAARGADLTSRLLAFARRHVVERRVLAMEDLLAHLEKMLRPLVGEEVRIRFDLSPEPLRVYGDPGQLEQVVMNLVANARDAMPEGGTLRFETQAVTVSRDNVPSGSGLTPGDYAVLRIGDSGRGMDPATCRRVLQPSLSAKPSGRGVGLGLPTCLGLVSLAQGAMTVESVQGEGTTISVYLPRAPDQPGAAKTAARSPVRGGTETVLVVEDDPQVRRTIVHTLAAAGYRVLEAGNGEEALAVAGARPCEIDLLLSDVVMPGLDARALATRLRAAAERIRVLFISGYSHDVISRRGTLQDGIQLLKKPFTGEELLGMVRGVLDTPTPANDTSAPAAVTRTFN